MLHRHLARQAELINEFLTAADVCIHCIDSIKGEQADGTSPYTQEKSLLWSLTESASVALCFYGRELHGSRYLIPSSPHPSTSSLILSRKMTKVTLHYDIVSPWSFMAYTSEHSGPTASTTLPDNSADLHPACAARSPEAVQAAVEHAARAETHVPGRSHAGGRQQAVSCPECLAAAEVSQASTLH